MSVRLLRVYERSCSEIQLAAAFTLSSSKFEPLRMLNGMEPAPGVEVLQYGWVRRLLTSARNCDERGREDERSAREHGPGRMRPRAGWATYVAQVQLLLLGVRVFDDAQLRHGDTDESRQRGGRQGAKGQGGGAPDEDQIRRRSHAGDAT